MISVLIQILPNPMYAIFPLLFLMTLFIGIFYWTWFKIPVSEHQKHAEMPLDSSGEKL